MPNYLPTMPNPDLLTSPYQRVWSYTDRPTETHAPFTAVIGLGVECDLCTSGLPTFQQ